MLMRCLSIAILLLLAAACSNEAPSGAEPRAAEVPEPADPDFPVMGPERTILAFGDSLFAGYNVDPSDSYPAKLQASLRAEGVDATVVNAGVSGDTSSAGAQRLAFVLDGLARKPDLVLLELGGNDMLRGIQPSQTRINFEAMLRELNSRDIPALLYGMRAPPNYGPEYQQQFDALYGELAGSFDAELIPFWLESIYQRPELFQSDRIHPTEQGIEELVKATRGEVLEALPESSEATAG